MTLAVNMVWRLVIHVIPVQIAWVVTLTVNVAQTIVWAEFVILNAVMRMEQHVIVAHVARIVNVLQVIVMQVYVKLQRLIVDYVKMMEIAARVIASAECAILQVVNMVWLLVIHVTPV